MVTCVIRFALAVCMVVSMTDRCESCGALDAEAVFPAAAHCHNDEHEHDREDCGGKHQHAFSKSNIESIPHTPFNFPCAGEISTIEHVLTLQSFHTPPPLPGAKPDTPSPTPFNNPILRC
jgi:hypothetical protein